MLVFNQNDHADALKALKKYKNIKAQIAALEAAADEAKAEILNAMGGEVEATGKVGGVTLTVTNKAITSTRIDTKAVKAKYPQVAAECSTTTTAPRFVVK